MSIELIYILIHMQIRECESTEKAAPFIWCGLGDSTNRVEIDAVSLFHPSGSYSPLQLALSNRHSYLTSVFASFGRLLSDNSMKGASKDA